MKAISDADNIICNKYWYIFSGLIGPRLMAICVTLVNETSSVGECAEDKRKLWKV